MCFTGLCKVCLLVSINIYLWRAKLLTQSTVSSCSFGKAVFKLQENRKDWQWSHRSAARPWEVLQKVVHPSGIVRLSTLLSFCHLDPGRDVAEPTGTLWVGKLCQGAQCLQALTAPPNCSKWINIWKYMNHLKLKCELHEYEKNTNSYSEMTNSSIRYGKNNAGAQKSH